MPAYDFKKKFVKAIENGLAEIEGLPLPWPEEGVKRQTIRRPRKRNTKAGDTLYLYTGLRTKWCRKLGEPIGKSVQPLDISELGILLNGRWLDSHEIEQLAKADGFESANEFLSFFDHLYGLPVDLELIKW